MSEPEEKVSVEEGSDSIVVVDPEDYHKTQKLKSIQEAKQHYKSFLTNETKKLRELQETWEDPINALEAKRAEALALYASELLPIIEEAIQQGGLTEDDLEVETDALVEKLLDESHMNIREIVDTRGFILANGEKQSLPRDYQLRVYRQLETIERKLGFGLDIEVDKGPAEI